MVSQPAAVEGMLLRFALPEVSAGACSLDRSAELPGVTGCGVGCACAVSTGVGTGVGVVSAAGRLAVSAVLLLAFAGGAVSEAAVLVVVVATSVEDVG